MATSPVQLIDARGNVLATASVVREGDHLAGTIDLRDTPVAVRTLFEEFEEIVNGQMFSFLDEIQQKVAALGIKAVSGDGREAAVTDLQVFPGTSDVSFRLVQAPEVSTVSPNGEL
jgi:hypothetical protein